MNKESLAQNLNTIISCSDEQISMIEKIISTTLETNEKFNLTAIKNAEDFREKMIYDSALPLRKININDSKSIDIGTGAGFPGLVLSILGNTHIDLLDSTTKKINYLNNLSNEFSIDINGIASRSEEFAKTHREQYDFAFARAVSELYILIEIIVPLLKVGGIFVAYKGPKYLEELKRAESIMKKLDVELVDVQKETLPDSKEERVILYIKKNSITHIKYPRPYQNIIK